MNLHQYLLAIQEGKIINFTRFLTLLPKLHQQNWRHIFSVSKVKGNGKFLVTVVDKACFEQLLSAATTSTNRAEAAVKGNSHQHKSSMSFVLVFPEAFNHQYWQEKPKCPHVVVCSHSELALSFKPQKTLVIIENQENFFRYNEFLAALLDETSSNVNYDLQALDIAFGHGNSITNALHADFFCQYQTILCCFDYDLGGLTMFSTLRKLFKAHTINTELLFMQPSNNQVNNEKFLKTHFNKTPEKPESWQQAIKLAEQLDLVDLAHAFQHTRAFMEQEVYLSDRIR